MPNVTLENLTLLCALLLLAGSLTGSVLAFLTRSRHARAARGEDDRFAAGGYERPIGWPEPAWDSGPIPTRSYLRGRARKEPARIARPLAAAALAFGLTTVGLYAYNSGLLPAPAMIGAEDPVGCFMAQGGDADARCVRFSRSGGPAPYGLSEKLSDTPLVWPAALRSR